MEKIKEIVNYLEFLLDACEAENDYEAIWDTFWEGKVALRNQLSL